MLSNLRLSSRVVPGTEGAALCDPQGRSESCVPNVLELQELAPSNQVNQLNHPSVMNHPTQPSNPQQGTEDLSHARLTAGGRGTPQDSFLFAALDGHELKVLIDAMQAPPPPWLGAGGNFLGGMLCML